MITEQDIQENMTKYPYITSDSIIKGIKDIKSSLTRKLIIQDLIDELTYLKNNEVQHE